MGAGSGRHGLTQAALAHAQPGLRWRMRLDGMRTVVSVVHTHCGVACDGLLAVVHVEGAALLMWGRWARCVGEVALPALGSTPTAAHDHPRCGAHTANTLCAAARQRSQRAPRQRLCSVLPCVASPPS